MSNKPLSAREFAIRELDRHAFRLIHEHELTSDNCLDEATAAKVNDAVDLLDRPTQLMLVGAFDNEDLWTENGTLKDSVAHAAGVALYDRVVRMAPKPRWVQMDRETQQAKSAQSKTKPVKSAKKGDKSNTSARKKTPRKTQPQAATNDTQVQRPVVVKTDGRPKPGPHLYAVRTAS